MHVPVAGFAVDPGERAAELGDEVVAPRRVAVPPAAGDALGTGNEHERAFLDRNYSFQQPSRPRPRLHELVRVPFPGRDAPPRVFGTMVGKRTHAIHGIAS